ncbi:hypothetical protein BGZ73_007007 [Actinomortierella ambigua]|nr:hypothetical protein BGZ73_007007 [Actinomortierella ambigua]
MHCTHISNVLLIGNTGTGKSFLLNSIGGRFQSGFNPSSGLTKTSTYCYVMINGNKVRLIDAPGLLEASGERMIANSRAITEALRMKGGFKLIFVLPECGGRVLPAELYTIGKVMAAIEYSIDVGIIINKVSEEDMKRYAESPARDDIIAQLNTAAGGRIDNSQYMVIPRYKRDNPKGPAKQMGRLLAAMKFQDIPHVTDFVASMQELNMFTTFLAKVGRMTEAICQWFLAPMSIMSAPHNGGDPPPTYEPLGHEHAGITMATGAIAEEPQPWPVVDTQNAEMATNRQQYPIHADTSMHSHPQTQPASTQTDADWPPSSMSIPQLPPRVGARDVPPPDSRYVLKTGFFYNL